MGWGLWEEQPDWEGKRGWGCGCGLGLAGPWKVFRVESREWAGGLGGRREGLDSPSGPGGADTGLPPGGRRQAQTALQGGWGGVQPAGEGQG